MNNTYVWIVGMLLNLLRKSVARTVAKRLVWTAKASLTQNAFILR